MAIVSRASRFDLPLSLALVAAGGAAMTVASLHDRAAFHFLPAMDGCVTTGVVSVLLLLAARVAYVRAVAMLAFVVLLQVVAAHLRGVALFAVVGLDLLLVGAVGGVVAFVRRPPPPRAAPAPAPEPAPRRARPAHAH